MPALIQGGVSVATSKTAVAPLERIKLLLQCQGELIRTGRLSQPYKGPIDCFCRIAAKEGLLSLWKGNLVNVIRHFPTLFINYVFNEFFVSIIDYDKKKHGYLRRFAATLANGVATGACTLLVLYPLDFARTRLAHDAIFKLGATQEFSGIIDVFRKTIASDGFLGLYRGYSSAVFQIAAYRACYFILSDTFKPMATAYFPEFKIAWYTLAYATTITSGLVSYPFDTVSRRMIMATGTNESFKYKSSIQAFSHIIREEGVLSLFLGAATNVLRSIAAAHVLNEHEIFDILRAFLMQ